MRMRVRRGSGGDRSTRAAVCDIALDEIDVRVSRLFAVVVSGLASATTAFLDGDATAAEDVIRGEVIIDDLHRDTEAMVSRQLLLTSAGIEAEALGRLILALRIVPELERSGDLVEHIAARASNRIAAHLSEHSVVLIREISNVASKLLQHAAGAFGGADESTGEDLRPLDDALDDLHFQLCDELAASSLPVAVAIEMGLVARFYERLGDHAVNVARRIDEENYRFTEPALIDPDPSIGRAATAGPKPSES